MPIQYCTSDENIFNKHNIPNKEDIITLLIDVDALSFNSESFSSNDINTMSISSPLLQTTNEVYNLAYLSDEDIIQDDYLEGDSTYANVSIESVENNSFNLSPHYPLDSPFFVIPTPRNEENSVANENNSDNESNSNKSNDKDSHSEDHTENQSENENTFRYSDNSNIYSSDGDRSTYDSLPSDDSDDNYPTRKPSDEKNECTTTDDEFVERNENCYSKDGLNIPITPGKDITKEYHSEKAGKIKLKFEKFPTYGEISQCLKCKKYFDKNLLFKLVESGRKSKDAVSQGLICLYCSLNYKNKQLQPWKSNEEKKCGRCCKYVSKRKYYAENKTCSYCLLKSKRKYINNQIGKNDEEKELNQPHKISKK